MNSKKLFAYVAAYAAWIGAMALGLWLFLLFRQALMDGLAAFYVDPDVFQTKMTARALTQWGPLFAGIALLVLVMVSEYSFRTGVAQGKLVVRISRTFGLLLLAVFALDLFINMVNGVQGMGLVSWLLLAVELFGGAGLTFYGYKKTAASSNPTINPRSGVPL